LGDTKHSCFYDGVPLTTIFFINYFRWWMTVITEEAVTKMTQNNGGSVLNVFSKIAVLPDGTTKVLMVKSWPDKGNPNHNLTTKKKAKVEEKIEVQNTGELEL
jgi:hypothetical protein